MDVAGKAERFAELLIRDEILLREFRADERTAVKDFLKGNAREDEVELVVEAVRAKVFCARAALVLDRIGEILSKERREIQ